MIRPKASVLQQEVRKAHDLGHPEAGGIRTALLAVALIGTAVAFAAREEPTINHQIVTANDNGNYFSHNVQVAWKWYQKQNQLAMDQIAINAAQQGVS